MDVSLTGLSAEFGWVCFLKRQHVSQELSLTLDESSVQPGTRSGNNVEDFLGKNTAQELLVRED